MYVFLCEIIILNYSHQALFGIYTVMFEVFNANRRTKIA